MQPLHLRPLPAEADIVAHRADILGLGQKSQGGDGKDQEFFHSMIVAPLAAEGNELCR